MIILNTGLFIILWILLGIAGLLIFILVCPIFYDINLDCKELSYKKINGEFKVKIMFFILAFHLLKNEYKIEKYIKILFLRLYLSDKKKHIKKSAVSEQEENDSSDFLTDIQNNVFVKKIKAILKKKDKLIRLYENEKTGKAVTKAKFLLHKILKHILPKKVSGKLLMGFEAPDITGKVYGIYSLIDEYLKTALVVIPDFENEIFCGKIKVHGTVVPIHLILYVLRLMFDKHIKITIRRAKKILRG